MWRPPAKATPALARGYPGLAAASGEGGAGGQAWVAGRPGSVEAPRR